MNPVAAIALAMARPWKPSAFPDRVRMPSSAPTVLPNRCGPAPGVRVAASSRSALSNATEPVCSTPRTVWTSSRLFTSSSTSPTCRKGLPRTDSSARNSSLVATPGSCCSVRTGSSKVTLRSIASSSRVIAICAGTAASGSPADGPTTVTLSVARRSGRRRTASASGHGGATRAGVYPSRVTSRLDVQAATVAAPAQSVMTGAAGSHRTTASGSGAPVTASVTSTRTIAAGGGVAC